jgi:hypothetical protein
LVAAVLAITIIIIVQAWLIRERKGKRSCVKNDICEDIVVVRKLFLWRKSTSEQRRYVHVWIL